MTKLFRPETARPAELRRWQAVWETTANPAAAWRCYRLARAWGLPIPLSVQIELDRVAAAFESEVEAIRTPPVTRPHPAAAPGLRRENVGRIVMRAHRGASDPAAALVAWERDFLLSSAVAALRQGGDTEAEAVATVAAGTKTLAWALRFAGESVSFAAAPTPAVSIDVVRRAVRRVRRLMPDTDG